ncbi:129_t:CDS:10 [Paraglomus occultum]|uniref:Exocyst complex protein EXO70 n=1 Tax=Paraglomus occultum TaxID=144539 RepID=A0A9N9C8K1_9GLOM|nr:129_t:CDS:10 [Paraglomus occultum]
MDRLDEENADLEFLEENLRRTNILTEKMCFGKDIDKTRYALSEIIEYFDLVEREEQAIKRGPEENLEAYLNSVGKCKRAMEILTGTRLRAGEKAMGQLKQLLKAAMLQLEELFRERLTKWSDPIEPLAYIVKNREMPVIPTAPLEELARLSSYLAGSDMELGYSSDFVRVYVDVRSAYLQKSLTSLAQGSINTAEKRNTTVYEKGTCGFISYVEALLRMFETEYGIASNILPSAFVAAGFRGAIQRALDSFVEVGKTLTSRVKKNMSTDVFLAFDMLETLTKNQPAFDELFRLTGNKDVGYGELAHSIRGITMRSFADFIDEIKNPPTKLLGVPVDGTVHEITITTLQHMKRLEDYPETVDAMLATLGDGNWHVSDKEANFTRDRTAAGSTIVRRYFADCLDALATGLENRAKAYKKSALTYIFLLNNYHYILKSIRTQYVPLLDKEMETKFEKAVKKNNDSYQDTWKVCFGFLMDFTYVRGGALKSSVGSDKQSVKERFKNFNNEFDELYKYHKTFAVPDPELRNKVINDIRAVLLPMYNRFLER